MISYQKSIRDHLLNIDAFKSEVRKLEGEKDIDILQAVKHRGNLADVATKRPIEVAFEMQLAEIKKEFELNYLYKTLLPSKSVSAQNPIASSRKTEK